MGRGSGEIDWPSLRSFDAASACAPTRKRTSYESSLRSPVRQESTRLAPCSADCEKALTGLVHLLGRLQKRGTSVVPLWA